VKVCAFPLAPIATLRRICVRVTNGLDLVTGPRRENCLADPEQGSQKAYPPDGGADLDHLGNADQVIAPDYAHEFAQRIDGARVELIGRAGHLPHIERPNQVSRVVRDFIGG